MLPLPKDFLNRTVSIKAAESRPHHPTQNNFLGTSQVIPHLIVGATPLSNGLPVDRNDLIEATTTVRHSPWVLVQENMFIMFTKCVLLHKCCSTAL